MSAFTLSHQNAILPLSLADCEYVDISAALSSWRSLSNSEQRLQQSCAVQKAWDGIIASVVQASLLARAKSSLDQARLRSACAEHSGDWLRAPPITAVELRLTDEMIQISVDTRLGARTCEPHTCSCGKAIDARGLHVLSCRKSAARHERRSHLNDLVWRAIKGAQILSVKETLGLCRDDRNRPDGVTLIPWLRGKILAWDVTVVDTFTQSHTGNTSSLARAAANHAATLKTSKYTNINNMNIFVPIAIETGGVCNQQAIEFIQEVGK